MKRTTSFSKLPQPVTLPASGRFIENGHLMIVLNNPSRQLLTYYRREHGFPRSIRQGKTSYTLTDDLADWLRQHGIEIRRL